MTERKAESEAGGDPSMEEILASIRRILSEDDQTAGKTEQPDAAANDVLVLDNSMIVPEPPAALAPPLDEIDPRPAPPPREPPAGAASGLPAITPPPAAPEGTPAGGREPVGERALPLPPVTLVAPEAAAAAASSVETLVRTLAAGRTTQTHRGGPTIEEILREEIRPLLKQWLDTYLPGLVERLVKAEIERVVGGDLG